MISLLPVFFSSNEIADLLGISRQAVSQRAKTRG